jgi:biopolymer transport protein ExbD
MHRRQLAALGLALAFVACGKVESKNPFDPPASAAKPAPKVTAPPKIKGPPPIRVEEHGPKIGWDTVLIEKKDGMERLAKAVAEVQDDYEGKPVEIVADRKAKSRWVAAVVNEMAKIDVGKITVITETTRPGFPGKFEFTPQSRAGAVPPCTLVMMIIDNHTPAIWSVAGGKASGAGRGLAGPDLARASDIVERRGKKCSKTSTFFVSAAEGIEWGLTYDLAVNATKVEDVKLDKAVILKEIPTAGRPVEL